MIKDIMENNMNGPVPQPLSPEEIEVREYKDKLRDLKIRQMKASVIRKQITEAYEILDCIRFDYLGDTAFREKIVMAKKNLEAAFDDFLLDTAYWREKIEEHHKMTPHEYGIQRHNSSLVGPACVSSDVPAHVLAQSTVSPGICTAKNCLHCKGL